MIRVRRVTRRKNWSCMPSYESWGSQSLRLAFQLTWNRHMTRIKPISKRTREWLSLPSRTGCVQPVALESCQASIDTRSLYRPKTSTRCFSPQQSTIATLSSMSLTMSVRERTKKFSCWALASQWCTWSIRLRPLMRIICLWCARRWPASRTVSIEPDSDSKDRTCRTKSRS